MIAFARDPRSVVLPFARGLRGAAAGVGLLVLGSVLPAGAQSVLERPPNMHGTWVGSTGVVYFNFIHRFTDTGEPLRKVVNYPTFLLATPVLDDVLLGIRYATNSELVSSIPNEWEYFVRYTPLSQDDGAPVDLSVHGAYNEAARSGDGEVTAARTVADRLRILAAVRGFTNGLDRDDGLWAWALGASVRISDHVAVAGDWSELLDAEGIGAEPAWSTALQLAIPTTPHTLSIQASNATTTTLQGASVGASETRWGFEFTVPFTLSRYFGGIAGGGEEGGEVAVPEEAVAAEVGMTDDLRFTPDTVRIRAGETVRWRNGSNLVHTVTADPSKARDASNVTLPDGAAAFDSGNLSPGAVFERTFDVPGEYLYFCIPHEAAGMVAWVIVEER